MTQADAQPAGGGSTVEITRSRATRRAILKVPGRSPASTSWPATSASSATTREHGQRVVDQPRYQRLLGVGVVPVAVGLARPVVVVGAKLDRMGCRDQPTDPTDRRDQLGDRVLGGDRILQHRGVQHPPAPPPKHPGRVHRPVGDQVAAPGGRVHVVIGCIACWAHTRHSPITTRSELSTPARPGVPPSLPNAIDRAARTPRAAAEARRPLHRPCPSGLRRAWRRGGRAARRRGPGTGGRTGRA